MGIKDQDYFLRKHLDSHNNLIDEDAVRIKDISVKNRNTQTPTRKFVEEGIQYDKETAAIAKSQFAGRKTTPKEEEEDKSIHVEQEHEKPPVSTVKK